MRFNEIFKKPPYPKKSYVIYGRPLIYILHYFLGTMDHLVIIRKYKPEDQEECRLIIKECMNSNFYSAFRSNLFKETTFQILVLKVAIMFIFLGLPCEVCAIVLPLVVILIWIGTYIAFAVKTFKVDAELKNLTK